MGRRFINAELTIQVDDWQQIDIESVKTFKKLNEAGKAIAIERIEELTEIQRYTQKEKNVPAKDKQQKFLALRHQICYIRHRKCKSHRSGSTPTLTA